MTQNLAEAFRVTAQHTLAVAGQRKGKPWEHLAGLEVDEAFTFSAPNLPERAVPKRRTAAYRSSFAGLDGEIPDAVARTSSLALLLSAPGLAQALTVSEAQKYAFSFYAVIFSERDSGHVAFVKKHNPLALMQGKSNLLGILSDDVLDAADAQVLTFAHDFDLVVEDANAIALRDVIKDLFLDLDLVVSAVPAMIAKLETLAGLKLSTETTTAMAAAIGGRKVLARRLLVVLNDPGTPSLTPSKIKKYLEDQQIDPAPFILGGEVTCTEANAEELIDHLGAMRVRHGFTGDLMRIDQRSKVTAPHVGAATKKATAHTVPAKKSPAKKAAAKRPAAKKSPPHPKP